MTIKRLRAALAVLTGLIVLAGSAPLAGAASRIKDLASVEGIRQNQLIGYGLVVGLNGTGDSLNNAPFTKQSLQAMLERLGVNIRGAALRTGNVAAVMVTANLPPFGTQGTRIDVTASALGDSKSLQGGTLLVTPLLGADGNVYSVAQGSVAIGGFQAEGDASKITRGVPTVGRIVNGAIIEREIDFALNRLTQVRLADVGSLDRVEPDGMRLNLQNLLSRQVATLPTLSDVIGRRYFNLVEKSAKWVRARSRAEP